MNILINHLIAYISYPHISFGHDIYIKLFLIIFFILVILSLYYNYSQILYIYLLEFNFQSKK